MSTSTAASPSNGSETAGLCTPQRSRSARFAPVATALSGALFAALLASACGGGGSGGGSGGDPAASLVGTGPYYPSSAPVPGADYGTAKDFTWPTDFKPSPAGFFVDPSQGGAASQPSVTRLEWGRLADIYDRDSATGVETLQHRDYLIGEDVRTDDVDYILDINPITEGISVVILHKAGSDEYKAAFGRMDDNLGPIQAKSLSASELPPFSFVPRNSAIRITFSDLLNHDTILNETVQLMVGNPPSTPFEGRVLADPNFGAWVGGPQGLEFRTSRVIIDTTISELEAQGTGLPVNSVGLPASSSTAVPNVGLRIPTAEAPQVGQLAVLRNYTGHPLSVVGNGPVDLVAPTLDVVRSMRAGGESAVTGDQNNGFLLDLNAPRILGSQPMLVTAVAPDASMGAGHYRLDFAFTSILCGKAPLPGDVIEQPGMYAEVLEPASPPQGGQVTDVRVRLILDDGPAPVVGQGVFNSVFLPEDKPECFLIFSPPPKNYPNNGVAPMSEIAVRFSKPMDPASINAFDTFRVLRQSPPQGLSDLIVATAQPTPDLREYRFVPDLPFAHSQGAPEQYFFNITGGADGLTDFAGNALATVLPEVDFTLDPDAPSELNGSIVLTFADADEDGNGFPELAGQLLVDFDRGVIKPRPVSRFAAVADRSQAAPSIMIPFPQGVQTPLSPLGSRMMTLWRYFDVGMSATDASNHNIDIEGLCWSPVGGQAAFDFYDRFEMRLAHSKFLPDEVVSPTSLLPTVPNSGLNGQSFDNNVLPDPLSSLQVVHPAELGYQIDPNLAFKAVTGTTMMPWPMNQGSDPSQHTYFTWRDTAIRGLAGPQGNGIDPQILVQVGLAVDKGLIAYKGYVPTIGLPLLMEFKCFPDDHALGMNAFDISIALNSSSRPNFRVFSTGGYNTNGLAVVKNPDLQSDPNGGFNPASNPPGKTTPGMDNVFYIGQMDIVVRVSHIYTLWLSADGSPNPNYLPPVLEPSAGMQPGGTQVVLSFRGSSAMKVLPGGTDPSADASILDPYGDQPDWADPQPIPNNPSNKNFSITFHPTPLDSSWRSDIDEVDGAEYIQVRIVFISNAESGLSPELSALGIAFEKVL